MITTRRTDLDVNQIDEPLCPLTRRSCLLNTCKWWDEDYHVCGMSPISLYNQVRDAVTDVAVDVMHAYFKEERHG